MPGRENLPFWLHVSLELPASLNLFFRPDEQLSSPAPQAHLIIKQYAVLLLVSNIIALIFALRPLDRTGRNVAAALSLYHLAPFLRAALRVIGGDYLYGRGLGGPWLHLFVHGICFASLMGQGLLRGTEKKRVTD